jgi:hypothetical protein
VQNPLVANENDSHYQSRDRAPTVVVTSTKSERFRPFSLDASNFLLADVRGALGPYLNVTGDGIAAVSSPFPGTYRK